MRNPDAQGIRERRLQVLLLQQRTRPIHVHVRRGDGEAVFNVEESVQLRESQNMTVRELSKAQRLAKENRQLILEKWHEHLG